jgi:hypothetical protein
MEPFRLANRLPREKGAGPTFSPPYGSKHRKKRTRILYLRAFLHASIARKGFFFADIILNAVQKMSK